MSQRRLRGVSEVSGSSDMRLVGALEAPWRCSRGALEAPQKCLGRAQHLNKHLRGASEPPQRRLRGALREGLGGLIGASAEP